jgi:hypothetical protein
MVATWLDLSPLSRQLESGGVRRERGGTENDSTVPEYENAEGK